MHQEFFLLLRMLVNAHIISLMMLKQLHFFFRLAIMECRDWSLCFLCQSTLKIEKTLDPSSSFKLRNSPERLQSCYKEALDNIQELKALGDLPEFIVDISGGSQDVVQLMIQNPMVWHKSCRNVIDKQKVERARKRKKE